MQHETHHQGSTEMFDGRITRIIEEALAEDIGLGDVTTDSIVRGDQRGAGVITAKAAGTVAGIEVVEMVFRLVDDGLRWHAKVADGARVEAGTTVGIVDGPLAGILRAERTALNVLQRMSGIATLTRRFADAVAGTSAKITDTRKTAPGLRVLDKLAVTLGGGVNHRFGLDDMVLIKDNHIAAAGGISEALRTCRNYLKSRSYQLKVEIETKSMDEVREALSTGGADRIMLDNFPIGDMAAAVKLINHAAEVEASGNVSLETVRRIAETGVDLISVGALTHSVQALDLSLIITATPS